MELYSRRLLPLTLALLVSGRTLTSAAAPPPATSAPGADKHFLWKVTDVPQPFYLLGSIHALRGSDYPIGAPIDQAISQCRRFLFEIDPEHLDFDAYHRKMRDAAQYPHGMTLKQAVSPKTYAAVQRIAKTRSSSYDSIHPWAIAMFMYGHPDVHDIFGYWGVESYVHRKASGMAEYGGLETADEHIRVLSEMIPIEEEVFLLQAMAYGDRRTKAFGTAVQAWKHGDTHGLVRLFNEEEREAPYIVQRMVTRRNANWIPKIENEMRTGKPTMIVVGARHLCGPYSVIELLRKNGHTLEQL